jgi:hypothetical protein
MLTLTPGFEVVVLKQKRKNESSSFVTRAGLVLLLKFVEEEKFYNLDLKRTVMGSSPVMG